MNYEDYNWENEYFLIADDDLYSYLLLEKILNKTRAKVDYASNGKDALEKIMTESSYTLAILDILMPKLSGFEVIEAARKFRPDLIYIAYSADVVRLDRDKCYEIGFHACIPKPILPVKLLKKLNEVLILRGQLL